MNKKRIVSGRRMTEKDGVARRLRREMTPAESLLWKRLRTNDLSGLHVRRQQIIDGFIADFYCHSAGLVIEVDGAVHDNQQEYDRLRDSVIAARGLEILRLSNVRIEHDIEAVLNEIFAAALSRFSAQSRR